MFKLLHNCTQLTCQQSNAQKFPSEASTVHELKISLCISNFLEELSRLSHSLVFLYFFPLITEEDFLISPCYSLKLCIQMGVSFLLFVLLFFYSKLFLRPPQTTILPFCIYFSWGWSLSLPSVSNLHPKFFRHSVYQI